MGIFWLSIYCFTISSGAPPQEAAKYEGDQSLSPQRNFLRCFQNSFLSSLLETPLRELISFESSTVGG